MADFSSGRRDAAVDGCQINAPAMARQAARPIEAAAAEHQDLVVELFAKRSLLRVGRVAATCAKAQVAGVVLIQ